jgi:hypothetical protein
VGIYGDYEALLSAHGRLQQEKQTLFSINVSTRRTTPSARRESRSALRSRRCRHGTQYGNSGRSAREGGGKQVLPETEAQAVLEAYEASGLSVAEFARRHGLGGTTAEVAQQVDEAERLHRRRDTLSRPALSPLTPSPEEVPPPPIPSVQ